MTNQTLMLTETEQERRTQARTANHGGLQVLDADRPPVVSASAITHRTTNDPYPTAPQPRARAGIEAANRLAEPTLPLAADQRAPLATLLLALLSNAAAIGLITWLL